MGTKALTAVILGAATLAACGAPLAPASAVSGMFPASALTLSSIEQQICKTLAARDSEPTLKNLSIDVQGCKNPGVAASNYAQISKFAFVGIDGAPLAVSNPAAALADPAPFIPAPAAGPTAASQPAPTAAAPQAPAAAAAGTTPSKNTSVRSELWLNTSFMQTINGMTAFIASRKGQDNTGEFKLPDSAASPLANLLGTKLTITAPPVLDLQTLTFSMALNLKTTGLMASNVDLQMAGQMIGNVFAITLKTVNAPPVANSLLKSLSSMILIVPYAEDVYLDMYVSLDMYNVGFSDIVAQQVNAFLSTELKGIIDALIFVQKKG